MLRNRSVATIDSPEFINLAPDAINPGISKCEIKVMYLGKNRNGSFIDKNTAIQMANSLPATPIVAAYNENKEDFGDHGEVLHIEDGEIKFSCKTVPYGFVAPDAEVWFQKFDDTNEFGETTTREYMMTTGYLWTGQYPELDKCINQGQGQSMEIDDVDGHWTTDSNDVEFFIINDAIFTKLCILGDDVEPCFEGASVTSPEVSEHFSYNKEFSHTLFAMMNELKSALTKGGSMPKENVVDVEVEPTATIEEETPAVEEFAENVETNEDVESSEDSAEETFAKEEEKKEDKEDSDSEDKEDESDDDSDDSDNKEDEKKPEKKHELENQISELSEQLKELTDKFTALEAEAEELRKFKAERIDADKDAMIAKYHMLSDEDKAEIIADKDKFTLGEIESKLALLYVQKNVNFDEEEEVDSTPLTTFSLDDETIAEDADPMLSALREAQNY
nr:MAG TPA: DNA-directed RNA polymerase subunit [Caudoviricetes sp.]